LVGYRTRLLQLYLDMYANLSNKRWLSSYFYLSISNTTGAFATTWAGLETINTTENVPGLGIAYVSGSEDVDYPLHGGYLKFLLVILDAAEKAGLSGAAAANAYYRGLVGGDGKSYTDDFTRTDSQSYGLANPAFTLVGDA
jgi:hypothetical protein